MTHPNSANMLKYTKVLLKMWLLVFRPHQSDSRPALKRRVHPFHQQNSSVPHFFLVSPWARGLKWTQLIYNAIDELTSFLSIQEMRDRCMFQRGMHGKIWPLDPEAGFPADMGKTERRFYCFGFDALDCAHSTPQRKASQYILLFHSWRLAQTSNPRD